MKNIVTITLADGSTKEVPSNIKMMVDSGHLTADEGYLFQRQLEAIEAKTYDVPYPDLGAMSMLSVNNFGGEGATALTYRSFDKRGEAKVIDGQATDLPRADIDGKEYTTPVKTVGTSFGYSRQELASAKMAGMPIEARKVEATRRAYMQTCNQLALFGTEPGEAASEVKMNGFFHGLPGQPWSTVTRNVVANGASGTSEWRTPTGAANKTPDEIINDVISALNKVYADSLKVWRPNTLIMSVSDLLYISSTPRSPNTDTSILSWILQNNEFIKSRDQIKDLNEVAGIYPVNLADDFHPLQDGKSGFTVASISEDTVRIREPFAMIYTPVQYSGLEFVVNAYGRFAGTEMVYPSAVQHFIGI